MNIHRKVGPFPVWAWGVAIAGGLVLGIYLRHGARSASAASSTDPNAALGALTNYTGLGMADPNAGMDSSGIISGLLQQNSDALSAILALAGSGGGGSPPAIGDPATYEPSASPMSTPTVTVASSSQGAAPTQTVTSDTPAPAPADPNYPNSTRVGSIIDTGTVTSTGLPIQETPAVAQGAEVLSAATSSTGGIGGAGYLLMSDKTLRPSPGVNVMQ